MSNFDVTHRAIPGNMGMFGPSSPSDMTIMNNLWAGMVMAAQMQMARNGQMGAGPDMTRNMWSPQSNGLPQNMSGRSMPQIQGAGTNPMGATPFRHSFGNCGNGNMDFASMLMQRLAAACPQPGANPSTPTPMDSTGLPPDSTGLPPDSTVEPTTDGSSEVPPAAKEKAFILGDLKKFGGGTVRNGLKDLLRSTTERDRKGERTHSKLSPEDTAKVKALLESTDPEVMKTLDMKVPNKKSLVISESGKLLDTVATKDIIANSSLNVAEHAKHMNDKVGRNFDRSAGGQIKVGSEDYEVAATELHSPIKISLTGENAKLDGKNGFSIDLDGFGQGEGASKTSGGLAANEAWLVRDQEGNGLTQEKMVNGKKQITVDGNDVYGDHQGKYTDGYNQLARDFASEIKTDANGKRYLDLTDPNSKAAKELKLLDASGKAVPASSILKRIDVDEMDKKAADEVDAKGNRITARANVTYLDGHTATSADQWYQTTAAR